MLDIMNNIINDIYKRRKIKHKYLHTNNLYNKTIAITEGKLSLILILSN